ncbi:MAG: hypothetical protein DIU64_001280 [Caldicoprobacter oshimai]|uniref:Uncharacterized protein n=1 Tax=Caldicoprobacter faecalis TaxID=937334 RepID=A0A1I5UGB9_9FIRM|nr:hypothetical protein [Caldicoprobacter faecalis]PZN11885.1 MAG: hypothetical protein DIU64_01405 [Caldicoprobacter oshimai]SFP94249.1 hypothetical protein SAMN05444406_10717 [Caldicoprobacter faecalis]
MNMGNQDIRRLLQMVQSMQGKSEDEMIRELAAMIKSGKGGITREKAEGMIKAIMPVLEPQQRRKLDRLLRELQGR